MDIKLKLIISEILTVLKDNYSRIEDTARSMNEDIELLRDNLARLRDLVEKNDLVNPNRRDS